MDHKIYCAIINKCEHYSCQLLLFNSMSLCGEAGMKQSDWIYKCSPRLCFNHELFC